jgi:hypothetical protein
MALQTKTMKIKPTNNHKRGNEPSTGIRKYPRLLPPFLNQDILKLTIKAAGRQGAHWRF